MNVKSNRLPFRLILARRKLSLFLSVLSALTLSQTLLFGDVGDQTNSIVRLEFQRGTNALGVVDVELFDQEKPETVRNFLLYVRSGAYSNSFMHRCIPGFIVQGGGFAVTNLASSSKFTTFLEVTNYGRLTNEFLVGARKSNTYGTIAMAKVANDPNSATSFSTLPRSLKGQTSTWELICCGMPAVSARSAIPAPPVASR